MSTVSFAPVVLDLDLTAGDAFDVTVPITTTAGDNADLTGYTAQSDVLASGTGARVDITATISGSNVRLQMTPAQTASLARIGEWDLRLVASGGDVATPAAGAVIVKRPATTIS